VATQELLDEIIEEFRPGLPPAQVAWISQRVIETIQACTPPPKLGISAACAAAGSEAYLG
jgi:hypothetical protein